MNRHLAFTVERLTRGNGNALVDGRFCESPIRVGDVFTKIYGHKQRLDGNNWVSVDPGPTESVRLVIQSIEAYRKQFDELSHGMTARLTIIGDGLDQLTEGRILGDGHVA